MRNYEIEVGTVLDNGDIVFHITDTEYWAVAPQSLWKECDWEGAIRHCQEIDYEMPDIDTLQLLYDCRDNVHNLPKAGVWSSSEHNSYLAWALAFGFGYCYNGLKDSSYWVVPFRRTAKAASDTVVGNTVPSTDQVQPVYTEGVYRVTDITGALSVVDRIHCDLDNHTVDKGYPVERTPVVVGGKEIPLEDLTYPTLLMGVRDRKTSKVVLYAAPLWSTDPGVPMRKVVCAACKQSDVTLVGPRHFCRLMHEQADAIQAGGIHGDLSVGGWEQGFIDQWEVFMDRHEALLVALAVGQPVDFKRNGGSGNELYSEGLY